VHADLIAGLPEYTLEMLYDDILKLMEIGVDELQIESLKVLPGTKMRESGGGLGLKHSPLPPYEVLRTSVMTPSELRSAMQLSRTIDLYYNAQIWQKVFRGLAISQPEFLSDFTTYLKESMMLDSPVSLERRGVILYEFCLKHHPEHLSAVSIAWILGGFSLKKEPAGEITKIKNLSKFMEESAAQISNLYGQASPTHRYFLYTSSDKKILFGYDAETHQPAPVFMAELR
jgi:hypothetical protein